MSYTLAWEVRAGRVHHALVAGGALLAKVILLAGQGEKRTASRVTYSYVRRSMVLSLKNANNPSAGCAPRARPGAIARLRLLWFVLIAALRDAPLPTPDQHSS